MADELREQAIEVVVENAEAIADQILADGIVRDIPAIGTIVGLAKIGLTIRDRYFIAKVSRFLSTPTTETEEERQKFYEQLRANEKLRRKTGEVIVLLLERFDDLEKPAILAKLYAALMKGKINFDLFRRLSAAVDLAYIEDLKQLTASRGNIPSESKSGLLRTGLTEISRMESPRKTGLGDQQIIMREIHITNLGSLFIEIMNEELEQ